MKGQAWDIAIKELDVQIFIAFYSQKCAIKVIQIQNKWHRNKILPLNKYNINSSIQIEYWNDAPQRIKCMYKIESQLLIYLRFL